MYNDLPFATFEKLNWYETQELHWIILAICLLVFLLTPLFWLAKLIINRIRKKNIQSNRGPKIAKATAFTVCILNFTCIITTFLATAILAEGFSYGVPSIIVIMLAGLIIASLLTIFQIALSIHLLRKKYWSVLGRIHYTIVTLASIIFIMIINYWNLLGFKL